MSRLWKNALLLGLMLAVMTGNSADAAKNSFIGKKIADFTLRDFRGHETDGRYTA